MTIKRRSRKRTSNIAEDVVSMPRYAWWEKEYAEHRYMRALPMKDLNKRFHDLMANMLFISDSGKIGISSSWSGIEWARYQQHLDAEAAARGLPFPYFLDSRYSPDWDKDGFTRSVKSRHSARAFKAVKAWDEACGNRQFSVVKYGKRGDMERFLHYGEILVRPSTTFDDETFNRAQRDDENSVRVFGARTVDGSAVPASQLPSGWGDRYSMNEFSAAMDRDYMLYCMSSTLSPTLFSQFGEDYDACVLIYDMGEFVTRINQGTKKRFPREGFVHGHCQTTYIDPLGEIPITPKPPKTPRKIPIPFLKHFRYAYQKEYRFVWLPKEPQKGLEKECVRIGSLEDIAEIIRI